MKIKFIAQYVDINDTACSRSFSPGGVSKMNYLLLCLKELGYHVDIYSTCARSHNGFSALEKGINYLGQRIKYRSSFCVKNARLRFLDLFWGQLHLTIKLLCSKSDDIIFLYHERYYTPIVRHVSRIRKNRVILDIEEIYTVAAKAPQNIVEKETRSFHMPEQRCRFLVATAELSKFIPQACPYIVCSGVYSPYMSLSRNSDDKATKQVLYSGTFDKNKGGVYIAIESAKYLNPSRYEINICGFGTSDEIARVEELISENNATSGRCHINYYGKLIGDAYYDLLSKCDIGLACQNTSSDLSESAFPSKIYEYLRFGLRVVSSDVSAVRKSDCASVLNFFTTYTADALAEAIESSDKIVKNNNANFLAMLHSRFKDSLKGLING